MLNHLAFFFVVFNVGFASQVWSARDFKPVKVLSGHEAKVTSVDVAGGKLLIFCFKF